MRKMLCCSSVLLLAAVLVHTSLLAQDRRPITRAILEGMTQDLPWIVQGQVINVEAKLYNRSDLNAQMVKRDTMKLPATEVTVKVERMIAGEYDGNELQFILRCQGQAGGLRVKCPDFSPVKVKVGDRVIVGIMPNMSGLRYNILGDPSRFFKLEGVNLIPYQEEYYLAMDNPLDVIAKKAKEREMPALFQAADLICTGSVTELIDPEKPSKKLVVTADELLKGSVEGAEVSVHVSDVAESFEHKKPGYRALLFLKKSGCSYKPVAGINGYYVIEGDKLLRGHTLPMRTTLRQVRDSIESWKNVTQ